MAEVNGISAGNVSAAQPAGGGAQATGGSSGGSAAAAPASSAGAAGPTGSTGAAGAAGAAGAQAAAPMSASQLFGGNKGLEELYSSLFDTQNETAGAATQAPTGKADTQKQDLEKMLAMYRQMTQQASATA